MLYIALNSPGPAAIRYPRAGVVAGRTASLLKGKGSCFVVDSLLPPGLPVLLEGRPRAWCLELIP